MTRTAKNRIAGLFAIALLTIGLYPAGASDHFDHNGTYYQIRPDHRKGMSPLCGGYWVNRVSIRYVDGTKRNLCRPTGCSGQICSDDIVITTCEWRPEYECIKQQICEPQADGLCGWTPTEESGTCFQSLLPNPFSLRTDRP